MSRWTYLNILEKSDNMRKTILFLLCFVLSFTPFATYANSESDEVMRILASIKSRIPDTNEFDTFNSSYDKTENNLVYHFDWNKDSDDSSYKYMSISVNSEGIITSYNHYDSKFEKPVSKPSITRPVSDEILPLVIDEFNKINPSLMGNVVISKSDNRESLTSNEYTYNVQRIHNGVPVYNDSGYISYSILSGTIRSFNFNYTPNLSFPDSENVISYDDAVKNYNEKIGMKLVYNTDYSKSEKTVYLAYIPSDTTKYIDANSAEVVTPLRPSRYEGGMNSADKEAVSDSLTSGGGGGFREELSDVEIKELEKVGLLISKDEAEKLIRENKLINAGDKYELARVNLSHSDDEYYYQFSFESAEPAYSYSNVNINAKNGKIRSIYQSSDYGKDEKEVGEDVAKDYVATLAPEYYSSDDCGKYRFESRNGNGFDFIRYENDIPYRDDGIYININPKDKRITSYNIRFSDVMFSATDGIIDKSYATERFLTFSDYKMYYYPSCSEANMKYCDTALLVYMPDMAKCSELYAENAEPVRLYAQTQIGDYADIHGHYAESIINKLSLYGIGFEEENFRPDEIICQKDFVALLVSVVSRNDAIILEKSMDYTPYYSRAGSLGIVKEGENSPESPVTRESAAVYMVRALGFEEVAKLDEIYVSKFNDVHTYVGYISILEGLGVVDGFGGTFNPYKNLTRADAMIMIYKYLSY